MEKREKLLLRKATAHFALSFLHRSLYLTGMLFCSLRTLLDIIQFIFVRTLQGTLRYCFPRTGGGMIELGARAKSETGFN